MPSLMFVEVEFKMHVTCKGRCHKKLWMVMRGGIFGSGWDTEEGTRFWRKGREETIEQALTRSRIVWKINGVRKNVRSSSAGLKSPESSMNGGLERAVGGVVREGDGKWIGTWGLYWEKADAQSTDHDQVRIVWISTQDEVTSHELRLS